MKRQDHFFSRHMVILPLLISWILGIMLTSTSFLFNSNIKEIVFVVPVGELIGFIIIYPFILTLLEICFLFTVKCGDLLHKRERYVVIITFVLGFIYTAIYVLFSVEWKDWNEVLINNEVHAPINTQMVPTVLLIALVGLIGYCMVSFIPMQKMPPLLVVLSIAAMYLGCGEAVIWIIQTVPVHFDIFYLLFPFNCVLITARTVMVTVRQWKLLSFEKNKVQHSASLSFCRRILEKSETWPFLAFLFMWPLLGILIAFLTLLGQAPDAVIKAWTETADWNLSNRIAPQNIQVDEHYLCTVAAGGHKKIVKPIRLGKRHGHEVIVNRQLCIANAFEQILEEKTPKFHKKIRGFYDKYGFPISRLIHSKYIADCIYFIMKPLEWFFLMVLYLVDREPENRIAVQYMGDLSIGK